MSESNETPTNPVKAAIAQTISSHKKQIVFALGPDMEDAMQKAGYEPTNAASPLQYALGQASGSANKKAPQLSFTTNPAPSDNYLGLYKAKRRLLPDELLKQIRITDNLVASILRTRGNMMSLFGQIRKNRFDIGLEVKIKPEFEKILTPEQHEKVMERMKKFEQLLLNCGHTEGLEQQDRTTLSEYLSTQAQNGLTFGRFGTEMIYDRSEEVNADGEYPFHRFRAVDVGTIYRTVRKGEYVGNNLRQMAIKALESLTGDKPNIDLSRLQEDEYAWLQVIDGTPRQAFTHKEMLVFNLFPSSDVEHNNYPVSPVDTCITSVTTHISIGTYQKLYFQNGRASKGMLIIQSDEVDQALLDSVRLQMQAGANSVSNSFRTPVFGIGKEDKVDWLSTEAEGGVDRGFEFMSDQVARHILCAFGMSPDELPGYAHLSRGTNSQTLSESNNEYKMEASRDSGLRPLILKFQIFFNEKLFPLMDPLLAKICVIRFAGLDAQNKEQESARLQQDSALHLTQDELLKEVDKEPIGAFLGGKFPFNERWQLIADKFLNVSELKSFLLSDPSALVDPMLKYKRDPFFLQNIQLLSGINPAAVKAYYSSNPFALDILKMNVQDSIEEEDVL